MPCLCYEPGDYTLTGNGASILEHTSLVWFLTTDGLLGTPPDLPDMPNGNLNQMFWKLLQNDGAIVNFIYNSLSRTYGSSATAAPAEGVIGLMPGAPAEPLHGAVHTVVFNDFEVTYRYSEDDTEWVEVTRSERVTSLVQVRQIKITTSLATSAVEATLDIPTTDENDNAFAFTIDDLVQVYVSNLNPAEPVIGVVAGYNVTAGVLRVVFTDTIPNDDDYELITYFRRITTI